MAVILVPVVSNDSSTLANIDMALFLFGLCFRLWREGCICNRFLGVVLVLNFPSLSRTLVISKSVVHGFLFRDTVFVQHGC